MAISFIAAGTVSSGATTATPGLPTGWQQGDLLVMVLEGNPASFSNSDWQTAYDSDQVASTVNDPAEASSATLADWTILTLVWRFAGASETAPTVTFNLLDSGIARIMAFRGVDPTTPVPNWVGIEPGTFTKSTSVSASGLTTSVAGSTVLFAIGQPTDTTTAQGSGYSNANFSYTERVDNNTNTGAGGGFSVATGTMVTPGSTGSSTATLATSAYWGAVLLELAPANTFQDGAASSSSTSAMSAVGASVRPAAASSASTAAMAAVGQQILPAVLSVSTAATTAMVGQADDHVEGVVSVSNQASASFVGQFIAPAVFSSSSQASLAAVGVVAGSGALAIQGQSAFAAVSEVTFPAIGAFAGQGTASFSGQIVVPSTFAITASAVATVVAKPPPFLFGPRVIWLPPMTRVAIVGPMSRLVVVPPEPRFAEAA